jgi:hypothetical protein
MVKFCVVASIAIDIKQLEPSNTAEKKVNCYNLLENQQCLLILNIHIPHDPTILLLTVYCTEMHLYLYQKTPTKY